MASEGSSGLVRLKRRDTYPRYKWRTSLKASREIFFGSRNQPFASLFDLNLPKMIFVAILLFNPIDESRNSASFSSNFYCQSLRCHATKINDSQVRHLIFVAELEIAQVPSLDIANKIPLGERS